MRVLNPTVLRMTGAPRQHVQITCAALHNMGKKAGPPQRNSCNLLNLPNLPNYLYMRRKERAGSSAWKRADEMAKGNHY